MPNNFTYFSHGILVSCISRNFGIWSLLVMGFKNIHLNLDGFTCMTFIMNHIMAFSVSCFRAANTTSIVRGMPLSVLSSA